MKPPSGPPRVSTLSKVRSVVAVASGKGGVGKSTAAVNLALALTSQQHRVGILDADLFGPSIPRLMNLSGRAEAEGDLLLPMVNYGVKCMSMGFLIDEEAPVVWRGLMVMKALQQLLHQVDWGELDTLIIDMPPGTGDTQLTVSQQARLKGAVIISTPQDVALADAKKGVAMFGKVNVPILGMIQNMSYFTCPCCSTKTHIFGTEGVRRLADNMGLPLLGEIPLNADVCELSDQGRPIVVARPESVEARAYMEIAEKLHVALQQQQ
ncbi:P-loop containing nucleoside triphosphate hydrolase protein [Syncephalis pseudoplumigaleata]|uniref:Nucleotide-binding protein-like n=1 Tax=Syncephalis pseudoplumigaleata TaxID=1712513 RepID=A0A4P9YVR4_9FUNG|nr:P-loop containing nucleoside triphosphate hydrolase protein [Syncephalis pseudoplumigaleata]|eukprot:RKP24136.1 P-loop containing nucleoside triphosphate hydrolase protein [Syncephalis pseudoplumigaleata]